MTRQQPAIHGASAAVFCADGVLIVKRARPPLTGLWSLPGGHIHDGETPQQAAIREVHEETGLDIQVVGKLGRHEVRNTADDGSKRTFVIEVVYGLYEGNRTPQAADDAAAARFVALAELNRYALTEGASRFILRAAQLLDTEGSLPCAKP